MKKKILRASELKKGDVVDTPKGIGTVEQTMKSVRFPTRDQVLVYYDRPAEDHPYGDSEVFFIDEEQIFKIEN